MKVLVIVLCFLLLFSADGKRISRPAKGRQIESRKQSEASFGVKLPASDSATASSQTRESTYSNVTLESRQYGPIIHSEEDTMSETNGSPSGEVEIPRPIPGGFQNPRPPRPSKPPRRPPPPGCVEGRGQFSSPRSCGHYLNCWDGTAVEQECPRGLLFNEEMRYCDYEYNVDCGSRPLNFPKPNLPETQGARCPDPEGRYRNVANCSEFFICLRGSPIKFSCPEGLVYNEEINVCDLIENVDCKGASTPKPLPPPPSDPADYPDYQNVVQPSPPRPSPPNRPSRPSSSGYPGSSQGGNMGYPGQGGGYPTAPVSNELPNVLGQVGVRPQPNPDGRPPQQELLEPAPADAQPPFRPTTLRPTTLAIFGTFPAQDLGSSTPESLNPNPPHALFDDVPPAPSPYSSFWATRQRLPEVEDRKATGQSAPVKESENLQLVGKLQYF